MPRYRVASLVFPGRVAGQGMGVALHGKRGVVRESAGCSCEGEERRTRCQTDSTKSFESGFVRSTTRSLMSREEPVNSVRQLDETRI